MFVHRGKWIRDRIKENGTSESEVAGLLGISHSTLLGLFSKENLSGAQIKRIGAVMKKEFEMDFTLLEAQPIPMDQKNFVEAKTKWEYYQKAYEKSEQDRLDLLDKYLKILERYVEAMRMAELSKRP